MCLFEIFGVWIGRGHWERRSKLSEYSNTNEVGKEGNIGIAGHYSKKTTNRLENMLLFHVFCSGLV